MFIKRPLAAFFAAAFTFSLFASASAQTPTAASMAAATVAPASTAALLATPLALQSEDRKEGQGPSVSKGDPVAVHYTGYLWSATAPDNKGTKIDSSIEKLVPFGFIVGAGRVIKGWEEGVIGMKVGGQRTLTIPADKAYGKEGSPSSIPPNAALIFDIELMSIIGKTANATATPSAFVPTKK
jgi:FKBP-type peptidyl-prolyl cis-trans isomerase FkpA